MPIDYSDPLSIDFTKLDPEKIDLGTCPQDCALITQTFERGAHSTYSEAAVFAPLARTLENTRVFAEAAQGSLSSYIKDPATTTSTSPVATQTQAISLPTGFSQPFLAGDAFGKQALDYMKNCIPCIARIIALMEINPNLNLLAVFEADIMARLTSLTDILGLLNNMDMYNELCALLDLLNFMCIPDLQRIIAMLAALLAFEAISLDGLIGMLRAIIAPLFMPVFSAITGLLDQFALLVVSPMDCIIDAINEQLRKLNAELDPNNPLAEAKNGLAELNKSIVEGKRFIKDKVDFYIGQMKALLDEVGFGDIAYTKAALRKLTLVRMIGFVTAVITAMVKGQQICSTAGKKPSSSELDNFFTNFLNPASPLQFWVDPNGEIHIQEARLQDTLPNGMDVVEFDREKLLDPRVIEQVTVAQTALAQTIQTQLPCRLSTSPQDVNRVNKWIEELATS